MQIEDRVFVVTGASSGIGLSTAEALTRRGGRLALVARSRQGFTQTARVELADDGIVVSEVYPALTATNFGANRLGSAGPSADYALGDSPDFVAGLVMRAIEEGSARYFANEHLRRVAGAGDEA